MTIDLEKYQYGSQLFSGGNYIEPIDPSFWQTTKASLGYTYDPLIEFLYNQTKFPELDPTYNPVEDVEGYEEFQSHLLYARSEDHMNSMKRGIDENKERREILANSSFWAQLGAGVFDPINLIALPLGGPALTIGKTFARGAVGVGTLQTGLEAIRYPVDPLATVGESALNIGFAAVTGGLISSAISVPMVRRNNAINKTIDSANESYNEGLELTTLGQMDNDQLKKAQSKPARKLFTNKSSTDIRDESSLNSKTIFGYDKILETGFLPDGNVAEGNALLNISAKRNKLIKGNQLIDQELAIRRLEVNGNDITDKYGLAAGAFVGNLISTPFKRALKGKYPNMAKKAIVKLALDSGYSLNLHKLGGTEGPSTYQRAKIMDGEWVGAQSELMKLYGDSIKTRIKTIGGMQVKDASTRIGNKFSKQKNQTSDDFFREVNRKRIMGEKASNASEAEGIEVINKFFKKWEERLEEVGFIGSKKRIESLLAEGRIKKDRIINDFSKYKNPKSDWVDDHNIRLNRLDAQFEEWEFSLATMVDESFVPTKGEPFFPRYYNTDYIKANRTAFAEILTDWFTENPYTYEIGGNLKWKRIDLKDSKQAIDERVEQTIKNILGENLGREDVPNVGAGKSKHIKHRVLDIPNSLIFDFIQQDPLAVMKGYTQKTAAKYQFAKMNNSKSFFEVMDEIIENMHASGNTKKEINKYRRDYTALYESIVTSPMKTSPDRWDNKTAYYLKEAAQLNYLGSAGLSAIPDFAKIIMEHDMGDVIKGLQALLTDTRVTLKGEEAKLVGEAIELIQGNSHFRIVDHITNDITATNTYDRIKNTFYLANGLAPITQFAKTLDSIIRGHSLINMSRKLAIPEKYGKASKLEVEYLARYNINKEIAMEIANAPYEETANGLILPNTKAWENNYQFPKHDAIVQYGPTDSYTKDNIYKAAFFTRKTNTIKFDREYIEAQFLSKPWTKPIMEGVKALPEDAFESPQSWANFVFMHEIMHNKFAPDLKIEPPKIYTKDDIKKYLNETIFNSSEKNNMDFAFHATNSPNEIIDNGFGGGGMKIGSPSEDKGFGSYIAVFDIKKIKKQNKIKPDEDLNVKFNGKTGEAIYPNEFTATMYGDASSIMGGEKPIAVIHESEVPRLMAARKTGMRSEELDVTGAEAIEQDFYDIIQMYGLEKKAGIKKSFEEWVNATNDLSMEWKDIKSFAGFQGVDLDKEIISAIKRYGDVEIFDIKTSPVKVLKKQSKADYENVINELALEQHNAQPRMTEETLETFRTALQSGILNTIIMGTPADKPIIVSGVAYIPMGVARAFNMPEDKIVKGYARVESGLLGLPFQFYSYSLGALSKISMSAAQGQMKNRALGLSMSLGLGMLAVQVKTPDWAFEQMDWDDWFARGFDQSGIAAIYSDLFYTSMQTALAMGAPNITGGIIEPKFPSDDAYGAAIGIGGAGPSIAYDYASAMKEFFIDGNYSEGAKNFTRSLPGARMWFWKGLVNDWTNSFKNW